VEIAINALLTVVGLAMLCFGGNWLVSGGVSIAKKLRISQMVIGLTVVAYGTSTPELAASIAATVGAHTDLILGNIVGSNISNVGMVIGISAIISPLVVSKATTRKEVPIMIGVMLLLVAISVDGEISQYDGILLIAGLIAFTVYTLSRAKKERKQEEEDPAAQKSSVPRAVGLIAIGSGLLYFGGLVTIENVISIAQGIGISETVAGITIVAIGTSLPELVTSIVAIKKGHTDIGIGTIVGSNIYNILMIMGIASMITGIAVVPGIFTDYLVMIGFAVVLVAFLRSGIIPRPAGIGLAIAGIICSLVILIQPQAPEVEVEGDGTVNRPDAEYLQNPQNYNWGQGIGLLLLAVVYALSLRGVGFLFCTSAFLVLGGILLGERRYTFLIPISITASVLVWYLVDQVLTIYLRPWPGWVYY